MLSNAIRIFLAVLTLFISIIAIKLCFSHFAYPKTSGVPGLLSKKSIDYLFIGSSLTRQSYDMELIDKEYKLNAYAVTYNSLSPAMAYKILNYTLNNSNVQIKNVIVEAYPYKLHYSPTAIEDVRLFNSAPLKLKLDILSDIYRLDHNFAKMYDLIVFADNEYLFSSLFTYKIIEKLSYNGGYRFKKVQGLSKFNRDSELKVAVKIDQRQCQYYSDIIKLCNQHKIKIIFIEPFVPGYVQRGENYTRSKDLIAKLISTAGNVFYENSSVQLDNNDPSFFGDDIHLSSKGREIWTREVMKNLRLNNI